MMKLPFDKKPSEGTGPGPGRHGAAGLLLAAVLVRFALAGQSGSKFYVDESDSRIELHSPYGTKRVVGEFGTDGTSRYRINIPLKALQATPTEAPKTDDDDSDEEEPAPTPVADATPTPAVEADR